MNSTTAGCELLGPDDDGYAAAGVSWNATFQHRPALVALPTTPAGVAEAVTHAVAHDLPIAVQSTGHGARRAYDGALLINTSRLREVHVDAVARTARVGAGVRWQELVAAAAPHGLAGLPGTSTNVGIVGYLLGGGLGWLTRRYGFAADHVRCADVVTADGRTLTASPSENAEFFDALFGSGGTLGVVTSVEIELFAVREVFAGLVVYPMTRAGEVTAAFRDWNAMLPPEVTPVLLYLRMPAVPGIPEPLAGKEVVAVAACADAPEARATEVLAPIRELPGSTMDTFAAVPFERLGDVLAAPTDPVSAVGASYGVPALTDAAIDDLLALVGAGSGCPCGMVEVRYVGGPRPAGARTGFAHYAADYVLHPQAVTPEPAPIREYLQRFAAALRPHLADGTLLNFIGDGNDLGSALRTSMSAERYDRLAGIKQAVDPGNRLRFGFPL